MRGSLLRDSEVMRLSPRRDIEKGLLFFFRGNFRLSPLRTNGYFFPQVPPTCIFTPLTEKHFILSRWPFSLLHFKSARAHHDFTSLPSSTRSGECLLAFLVVPRLRMKQLVTHDPRNLALCKGRRLLVSPEDGVQAPPSAC